jgi:hypothetical protein
MKTASLIEALARDTEAVRVTPLWPRLSAAAAAGAVAAGMIVILFFGVRPDLSQALGAALTKSAFCLAAVAVAAPLALNLSQPSIRVRGWAWPAALFMAASLVVAAIAVALAAPDARLALWTAGGPPACLGQIPVVAIPVMAALLLVARGFAPTRLTLAGAALGGLAGAIAAVAYSWFCPIDSVAYVATWYLAAVLLCAGLGAALGRWTLRW